MCDSFISLTSYVRNEKIWGKRINPRISVLYACHIYLLYLCMWCQYSNMWYREYVQCTVHCWCWNQLFLFSIPILILQKTPKSLQNPSQNKTKKSLELPVFVGFWKWLTLCHYYQIWELFVWCVFCNGMVQRTHLLRLFLIHDAAFARIRLC